MKEIEDSWESKILRLKGDLIDLWDELVDVYRELDSRIQELKNELARKE